MFGILAGLVGSVISGKAKRKAAKNQQAAAVAGVDQDREYAKALALYDSERLKAASGFNLGKLRDDAIKAGFNPLTLLQATGGAGYDGRGAVVLTPFGGSRSDAIVNTSADVVGSAGYIGDAISGAGAAFSEQRYRQQVLDLDRRRYELEARLAGAYSPKAAVSPFSSGSYRREDASWRGSGRDTVGPFVVPATRRSAPGMSANRDTRGYRVDIEQTREEYGDSLAEVYGVRNWAWDFADDLRAGIRAIRDRDTIARRVGREKAISDAATAKRISDVRSRSSFVPPLFRPLANGGGGW